MNEGGVSVVNFNNTNFVERLVERSKMIKKIRSFFDDDGFVEVETPVRIKAPAPECHIDCPSVTTGGFLRASPELQMKKLLAMGMDKIYQIGPCFRDGEKGSRHNPEFTMIEWYRNGGTDRDIANDLTCLLTELLPTFTKAKEISVREAYLSFAGWDPFEEWDGDRFDFDMATKIEPQLKQFDFVFLRGYPPQSASLATIKDGVAQRWEFYAHGIELANCFTELCDPTEQKLRFEDARKERRELGEADYPIDEEFFSSLEYIDSAAGVALGIDRLAMVLLNEPTIENVRVV